MKTRAEAVYDFSTLWTIARELLEQKWAFVYLAVLDVQEIGDGLVSFAEISRLRYWQVWPGTFKRERLPTVDEPHFPEEAKKQQPKTKRGGIKILPPNGIQHAPEEVCDYGSETSEDDPPHHLMSHLTQQSHHLYRLHLHHHHLQQSLQNVSHALYQQS